MVRKNETKSMDLVDETWGIFLQSTGILLDRARSKRGALSKQRSLSKGMPTGYCYVDRIN